MQACDESTLEGGADDITWSGRIAEAARSKASSGIATAVAARRMKGATPPNCPSQHKCVSTIQSPRSRLGTGLERRLCSQRPCAQVLGGSEALKPTRGGRG